MAEGHAVHGMAQRLRQLAGTTVRSVSPDGAFPASAYDGKTLVDTEAHGKHLLVRFDDIEGAVHIHCGMTGRVSTRRHRRALGDDGFPKTEPPAANGLRWRLLNRTHVADVIAPTICEVLNQEDTRALHARLGPDPLRDDHEPEPFFTTTTQSRRAIGMLLLDQRIVAGIGNVYRAEILFRQGIHPWSPGNRLSSTELAAIWSDAVELMAIGLGAGWIVAAPRQLTEARELIDQGLPVPRWPKTYAVYGRRGKPCRQCGTPIEAARLGQQTAFWCPVCQPPRD